MNKITAVKKLPLTLGLTLTRNDSKKGSCYFPPVIGAATALTSPKSKGRAILLQACTDLGDSRRLRLPDFQTVGT